MTTPSSAIEQGYGPFIGLRPFEEQDAPRFFGRTEQIAALLRRLGETRFLAVVGTSGCGKSSLVRAGLIPSLKRGYLVSAGSRWKVAVMRPGGDPFGALAGAVNIPGENLRRSSLGLVKGLEGLLDVRESVLLVVDQFEELFRFRRDARDAGAQSDAFVKLLLASAGQDEIPIYVVLTMRSDYLGDCAVFRGLPEALNDAQYLVPVLTRRQLREVVEAPVAGAGAQIAPELVQRVLNDAGHGLEQELDQLPVLQHALMRTWGEAAAARAAELGLEHYRKSGGMTGALNLHAERLYNELSVGDRAVARRVFQRLAEKEFQGRDIRRPTSFGELRTMTGASEEQLQRVIWQFQDFLTSRPAPPLTDASIIDITHEALIRQWKELLKWAEEEARSAQVYLRLDYDALRAGRLWEDPDLRDALDSQQKNSWNATWALRYTPREQAYGRVEEFLRRSKRHRVWKRVQRWGLVLAALAIPAALYFWQVQTAKREAELLRKDAELQRVKTQSGEAAARAERFAAEAVTKSGAEKARLEAEAAKARADSDRLAASAKDYQTLREAELAALQKSRDDLNAQLKKARDDNGRLSSEKADLNGELKKAKDDNSRLSSEKADLNGELKKAKDDNSRLSSEKADLNGELKKAKDDNSRLSSEKADLQKRLTAAEADKAESNRKLEAKAPAAPQPGAGPGAGKSEKAGEVGKAESKNAIPRGTVKSNPIDGLRYVWIPPGDFAMGCSPGDNECLFDELKPPRKMTISNGFWLGQTEVTQAAWTKVMGGNPSGNKGDQLPVENVDWNQAVDYCQKISGRLPTEQEWEYAARAGTTGARYGSLDAVAWYGSANKTTHPVRLKQPNKFGLYDMLGNVFEWTSTDYGTREKVVRGGSKGIDPEYVRASYRNGMGLEFRDASVGFRCVGEFR